MERIEDTTIRTAGGEETERRAAAGSPADPRPRARVLFVDDVAAILEMFREYYTDADFIPDYSSSGEEAIDLIRKTRYTVVVTDLRMHPVSGLDVIKATKETCPETEVIVLTGYASVESTLDAIRYHVFDYVEKPVQLEKFSRILHNALEKARLTGENRRLMELLQEQNIRLERRVREVTRELQELSTRDALTGLFNFRYFTNVLVAEVSRAMRYGRDLTLAMLDIDFFKQYNDDHGHQGGNEALVRIGGVLRAQTRENDTCVRYGGEEFAVILPETGREEAEVIIERIRREVRALSLAYSTPDGEGDVLTLSAGIAACPAHARTDQALVRKADDALYRAKAAGRDRICAAGEE
jgi:two-component system chemotaxis family response regulator WspR